MSIEIKSMGAFEMYMPTVNHCQIFSLNYLFKIYRACNLLLAIWGLHAYIGHYAMGLSNRGALYFPVSGSPTIH